MEHNIKLYLELQSLRKQTDKKIAEIRDRILKHLNDNNKEAVVFGDLVAKRSTKKIVSVPKDIKEEHGIITHVECLQVFKKPDLSRFSAG